MRPDEQAPKADRPCGGPLMRQSGARGYAGRRELPEPAAFRPGPMLSRERAYSYLGTFGSGTSSRSRCTMSSAVRPSACA